MAAAPEGHIQYANVPPTAFRNGSMTLTHGITPNVCTIETVPTSQPPAIQGPLTFLYGGTRIQLPQCRLSDISYYVRRDGFQVQLLKILDRRWKWRFGWIRGSYNIREGDNTVTTHRGKKPHELAALLLKAMGETKWDIGAMPNDELPYVDWDGVPANYLSELCQQLGCRIFVNPLNNLPTIVKTGVGRPLPARADMTADSLDVDPPELPDEFVFIGAKTLWQHDMRIEAVGEQPDGEIVPIDDLDYMPDGGWEDEDPVNFSGVENEKHRDLAKKSVWKYYRIKVPFKTPWGEEVKLLDQILPIEDRQVQLHKIQKDVKERIPAWVVGKFDPGEPEKEEQKPWVRSAAGLRAKYERPFSIDADRGLVIFSEPVYARTDFGRVALAFPAEPDDVSKSQPELFLRTAFGIRDEKTWAWHRFTVYLKAPGKKQHSMPHYIDRHDVGLRQFKEYRAGGAKDRTNRPAVLKAGRHYIDQAIQECQLSMPGTRSYASLVPVPLDGAIHQVTWSIDDEGFTTTSVSRNQETPDARISYQEKREKDRIRVMLEEHAAKATGKKDEK